MSNRLLKYSTGIVRFVETLPRSYAGNHIANQLLRSGTSAYPNHAESQAAESVNDFIHKLKISLKGLRETKCWLLLIAEIPLVKNENIESLITET